MVTIAGPNVMMDTLAPENRDPATPSLADLPSNLSPLSGAQISPPSNVPPPNPPFVFPARAPTTQTPSHSQATRTSPTWALGARDISSIPFAEDRSVARRHSVLPDFSFPMAASQGKPSESSFLSPPQSPQSPRTIPARPAGAGHRRGGSEFVGGSIRGGDSITVLGTSPTKSDSGLTSPGLAPIKPWRGHAHRRSRAASSHDLSSIMLPSSIPGASADKGSSAPVSPAFSNGGDEPKLPEYRFPGPAQSQTPQTPPPPPSPSIPEPDGAAKSESDGSGSRTSGDLTLSEESQSTPKAAARNRVGFSDTLEYIPRPLSLVSSDASSTATARPGHSVSGSISSVISLTNPPNAGREPASASLRPPQPKEADSRPSTAGAVLERTQSTQDVDQPLPSSPRRRNSIPYLNQPGPSSTISSPEPSPGKAPKRWSIFGIEPFAATSGSPAQSSPPGGSPPRSRSPVPDPPTDHLANAWKDSKCGDQKLTGRKRSKRQKKVKTWAGSILSRKPKHRHPKPKRRTPTPPPRSMEIDEDEPSRRQSLELTTKPITPTVMITEPPSGTGSDAPVAAPYPAPVPDDDTSHPMIDLDAALGPFNTPLPRNPEWEAAQRAGGPAKKQLHSAAGMSRFTGPGMHYFHRRTESAPEMAPFEADRFGIPRFGSSSTMADVFEEDEEDDSDTNETTGQSTPIPDTPNEKDDDMSSSNQASDTPPASVSFFAADPEATWADLGLESSQLAQGPRHKGSDLSDDGRSQASSRVRSETASASLHDEVIAEESESPCIPGFKPPFATTSNEQPESPAPSPRQVLRSKDLAPVDVSPLQLPATSQAPISPYSMTQPSSAFPSPRSPGSYDAQRISTAPSSVTEDNFQSLLMGEPGPEVRISVDDIPSLTSSNSTMTRDSSLPHNPHARQPAPFQHQPRPASFTSTAFGRRRSSLASLSRLINTSHGERSKLSMEVTLDSEPVRRPKVSKTKRLSRMMQFWRPKEHPQE